MVLTLELLPSGTHAGNDVSDVSENSGEQQKSKQQLDDDEQVLELAPWSRQVPDGCKRQRAPIITLKVLFHHIGSFTVTIHPILAPKRIILVNYVI